MHFSVPSVTAEKVAKTTEFIRSPSVSIKYLAGDQYKYTAVVSKKQGNSAKRNRIKRIIREIMRHRHDVYPSGFYLVFFNKSCDMLDRLQLQNDLDDTIGKITSGQINRTAG